MRTFMTTAKRAVALLALATAGAAVAATATWTVTFEGPGGHSNGNYGNVNAVHAGARAVMDGARRGDCGDEGRQFRQLHRERLHFHRHRRR